MNMVVFTSYAKDDTANESMESIISKYKQDEAIELQNMQKNGCMSLEMALKHVEQFAKDLNLNITVKPEFRLNGEIYNKVIKETVYQFTYKPSSQLMYHFYVQPKTGEVLRFYIYNGNDVKDNIPTVENRSRNALLDFLCDLYPNLSYNDYYSITKERGSKLTIEYYPYVNGAPFLYNKKVITIDKKTNAIISIINHEESFKDYPTITEEMEKDSLEDKVVLNKSYRYGMNQADEVVAYLVYEFPYDQMPYKGFQGYELEKNTNFYGQCIGLEELPEVQLSTDQSIRTKDELADFYLSYVTLLNVEDLERKMEKDENHPVHRYHYTYTHKETGEQYYMILDSSLRLRQFAALTDTKVSNSKEAALNQTARVLKLFPQVEAKGEFISIYDYNENLQLYRVFRSKELRESELSLEFNNNELISVIYQPMKVLNNQVLDEDSALKRYMELVDYNLVYDINRYGEIEVYYFIVSKEGYSIEALDAETGNTYYEYDYDY